MPGSRPTLARLFLLWVIILEVYHGDCEMVVWYVVGGGGWNVYYQSGGLSQGDC